MPEGRARNVFDPRAPTPEEPVAHGLPEELSDIWRDVHISLVMLQSGRREAACAYWKRVQAPWGELLVGAFRWGFADR